LGFFFFLQAEELLPSEGFGCLHFT